MFSRGHGQLWLECMCVIRTWKRLPYHNSYISHKKISHFSKYSYREDPYVIQLLLDSQFSQGFVAIELVIWHKHKELSIIKNNLWHICSFLSLFLKVIYPLKLMYLIVSCFRFQRKEDKGSDFFIVLLFWRQRFQLIVISYLQHPAKST